MANDDSINQPTLSDARLPVPLSSVAERAVLPLDPRAIEPADAESNRFSAPSLASPMSMSNLLKAFRHRWLAAVSLGVTLLLVFAGAAWYFLPAKYTAYALIRVSESEPQPLIPTQGGGVMPVDRYFENTQVALIKSRPILLAALRQPSVEGLHMIKEQDDAPLWLEENLKVAFLEKTDILRVSLDGTDPKEIATIVNAVKDAYMNDEILVQRNKKLALLDDLEKVYLVSEDKLRNQRAALRDLAQRLKSSDLQALTIRQKAILEEYAVLRKELSLLQAHVRGAEIALAVHKAGGDKADFSIPDVLIEQGAELDTFVVQKKMELAHFDSKLSYVSGLTEPGHSTRERLEKERKRIEEDIEKHRATARAKLSKQVKDKVRGEQQLKDQQSKENLEVWKKQEELLRGEVDRILKEAQNIGITTFELELKRSELEQGEAVIRRLREEKERLQVELQSSKQRVSVLHPAEAPTKKNLMAQARIVGFAGAMGLFLGLFGVCYWEARAHRIMNKEEVVNVLGCRVVGVLPWVTGSSKRQNGEAGDHVARLTASVGDLRARLLCEAESQGTGQVLLVTSAVAREGKTTLACHLAVSVAQAGRRTLLIDADLNRPQLHRVFELSRGPGLSEVLSGGAAVNEAVQQGPVAGLSVLAAGENSHTINSAQMMTAMRTLLEAARKEYDFILIDSPPVLPVPDALLLGRRADGVLLSVRPSVSQFPLVSAAYERLTSLRIPVMGAVVNGVRSREGDYDYGYVTESAS